MKKQYRNAKTLSVRNTFLHLTMRNAGQWSKKTNTFLKKKLHLTWVFRVRCHGQDIAEDTWPVINGQRHPSCACLHRKNNEKAAQWNAKTRSVWTTSYGTACLHRPTVKTLHWWKSNMSGVSVLNTVFMSNHHWTLAGYCCVREVQYKLREKETRETILSSGQEAERLLYVKGGEYFYWERESRQRERRYTHSQCLISLTSSRLHDGTVIAIHVQLQLWPN